MTISIIGNDAPQQPINQKMPEPSDRARLDEPQKENEGQEYPVKAEILTKTDIEVRKLHAIRRAKEYLEEQLASAALEAEAAASQPAPPYASAAEREYSARAGQTLSDISVVEGGIASEELEKDVSYKTGEAIKGYKIYKKETPKAWDEADVDEKR